MLLAVMGFASIADAAEKQRLALVIGNGGYQNSPLANPVNDATDIARALTGAGFKVMLKTEANRRTMELAIREFGRRLRDGGVGLFYFAGHGLQIDGRNYLVPVGAVIEGESDVRYEAVDAGFVLGKMEDAGNGLNIIILDACRDNPFARSFRSSEKGLAKMDAPVGSILAYATAPGSVAADGKGRNGLYTSKLLEYLPRAGLKIEDFFKQVRRAVLTESANAQVPWESSSLAGDFYFVQDWPHPAPTNLSPAQAPSLASLEAERQRIEIEKLKMQLEIERLKAEKARLTAEGRVAEVKKPSDSEPEQVKNQVEPPRLAVVKPEPTVVPGQTGLPLKLALLAVHGSHNIPNWGDRSVDNRIRSLADFTTDLLMDRKDILFSFSCLPHSAYRQTGWVRRNVQIISDDLSGEAGRQLWYRPSMFSDWQPAEDRVLAQARRFGADLVLMYRFSIPTQSETSTLQIYLLDVARSKLQRSSLTANAFRTQELRPILEGMLRSLLDAAPQGASAG